MGYLLFDTVFLALPVAVLLRRAGRLPWSLVAATGLLAGLAAVWTGPWDGHLIRTGIWSYDPGAVVGRVGPVPVEEYAFVLLMAALVAVWGLRSGRLPGRPAAASGSRAAGALAWSAVTAVGALLLLVDRGRYLGLLLVWAGPPLALQRAVAGDLLRSRLPDRLVLAAPVALWLCVADRVALAAGIWTINPASSTGLLLLGLPLEEALFFGLTSMLLADGLLLATDARALARVGAGRRRTVDA